MKKVILSAAALMIGAVTFGQQTNPKATSASAHSGCSGRCKCYLKLTNGEQIKE